MTFSARTRVSLAGALGSPGRANEILGAIEPRVLSSEAVAALTNDTGGTADGTLAVVGDTTVNQAAVINNNLTELFTQLDAIRDLLVANGFITE